MSHVKSGRAKYMRFLTEEERKGLITQLGSLPPNIFSLFMNCVHKYHQIFKIGGRLNMQWNNIGEPLM